MAPVFVGLVSRQLTFLTPRTEFAICEYSVRVRQIHLGVDSPTRYNGLHKPSAVSGLMCELGKSAEVS